MSTISRNSSPTLAGNFESPIELPEQLPDIPASEVFEKAALDRNPRGPFNMTASVTFRDDLARRISDGFDDREMPFVLVPFKSDSGVERWEPFKLDLKGTSYDASPDHSHVEQRDRYQLPGSLPPSVTIDGQDFGNVASSEGVAFGAVTAKGILWGQDAGHNTHLPSWET